MIDDFYDILAKHAPAESPEDLKRAAMELEILALKFAKLVDFLKDTPARQDILAGFKDKTASYLIGANGEPISRRVPPEVLEWARTTFSEEEYLAGLRDIETTGGLELKDFIHELEAVVNSRE